MNIQKLITPIHFFKHHISIWIDKAAFCIPCLHMNLISIIHNDFTKVSEYFLKWTAAALTHQLRLQVSKGILFEHVKCNHILVSTVRRHHKQLSVEPALGIRPAHSTIDPADFCLRLFNRSTELQLWNYCISKSKTKKIVILMLQLHWGLVQ